MLSPLVRPPSKARNTPNRLQVIAISYLAVSAMAAPILDQPETTIKPSTPVDFHPFFDDRGTFQPSTTRAVSKHRISERHTGGHVQIPADDVRIINGKDGIGAGSDSYTMVRYPENNISYPGSSAEHLQVLFEHTIADFSFLFSTRVMVAQEMGGQHGSNGSPSTTCNSPFPFPIPRDLPKSHATQVRSQQGDHVLLLLPVARRRGLQTRSDRHSDCHSSRG